MYDFTQKLELENTKQVQEQSQVKEHEEQVKLMEDELNKLKAENESLLHEKSQLAVNLTALVSCTFISNQLARCVIDDNPMYCQLTRSWHKRYSSSITYQMKCTQLLIR